MTVKEIKKMNKKLKWNLEFFSMELLKFNLIGD